MKRRLRVALIAFLALIVILGGAFLIYASDYYRADEGVAALLESDSSITMEADDRIVLEPSESTDTALIFYPGAKVEYISYLPILKKINEATGITCVLVKMPFNMAIFDVNAADQIIEDYPEIEHWYIGGHSMGGAMASSYASNHQEEIDGLILLGAYIYGEFPEEKALTIYGTFNTSVKENIDYSKNIVVIQGGNHAQFGNYGKQKGDPDATISAQEQQDIAVEAIKAFLEEKEDK